MKKSPIKLQTVANCFIRYAENKIHYSNNRYYEQQNLPDQRVLFSYKNKDDVPNKTTMIAIIIDDRIMVFPNEEFIYLINKIIKEWDKLSNIKFFRKGYHVYYEKDGHIFQAYMGKNPVAIFKKVKGDQND